MVTLYAATTNAGKLKDFAQALTPGFAILPLPGVREMAAPVEDAESLEGNARLKAVGYSRRVPGVLVLADDSGLEVDALEGAPGVRSARFAQDRGFSGTGSVDERNNACLLEALGGIAEVRTGRYKCVLALARDGVVVGVASGSLEGEILRVGRGSGGFGYDPLFLVRDEGLTMAELGVQARLARSHRGRALRSLLGEIAAGRVRV